jgi:hypothetical protein
MDTDQLSNETYEAVLTEAEKFDHDLCLPFGLLAEHCENESEYLDAAKELTNEIKGFDEDELSDIFYEAIPDLGSLHKTLDKILTNISEIEKIPEDKRHYDF